MSEDQSSAPFDAAGFVKLWRDYGYTVSLDRRSDGRMSLSFSRVEGGLNFPPTSEQEGFGDKERYGDSWEQAVIDFLLAEEARK